MNILIYRYLVFGTERIFLLKFTFKTGVALTVSREFIFPLFTWKLGGGGEKEKRSRKHRDHEYRLPSFILLNSLVINQNIYTTPRIRISDTKNFSRPFIKRINIRLNLENFKQGISFTKR